MGNFDMALRPEQRTPAAGLASVGLAFRRALVSQCHPKMLLAIFMPFLVALVGAIILLWLFWTPLTNWLDAQAAGWTIINSIDQWLLALGLFSIKLYLIPVLAAGILLPLSGIMGLVVAAVFIMPIVLRHIEAREYLGLARNGQFATLVGAQNALWVTGVFVVGWLVTMPLWLVPPLSLILPVFWWAYAFSRMLRMDALAEHASSRERKLLWRRHNGKYWLIGGILSVANLFPPLWLVLPVFSALVFAHFSLEALRQLRQEALINGRTL